MQSLFLFFFSLSYVITLSTSYLTSRTPIQCGTGRLSVKLCSTKALRPNSRTRLNLKATSHINDLNDGVEIYDNRDEFTKFSQTPENDINVGETKENSDESNIKNFLSSNSPIVSFAAMAVISIFIASFSNIFPANAMQQGQLVGGNSLRALDTGNIFDPSNFQPVCPASDGIYQLLKYTANGLVGPENVVEYGPLIASVLLRVRLELCVLESFLNEAVVPFVQQKGLSWVLPLHETVETFLAGTIFAIASNFILLGSTKIISVLLIYFDAITGLPARILGGGLKRASSKEVGNIGTLFQLYGDLVGNTRKVVESIDTFVGRYLVIATTGYIAFKLLHYRLFNDIF